MDQNSHPSPGLHLPQPSMAQPAFPPAAPVVPVVPQHPEVQAIVQPPQFIEQASPQPQIQHYQPPVAALPVEPPVVRATIQQTPAQVQVPELASTPPPPPPVDVNDDAVDDEWIGKARAIAEQYRGDPYAQSNALSKLKAEYLQARHGKVIKVNDSL